MGEETGSCSINWAYSSGCRSLMMVIGRSKRLLKCFVSSLGSIFSLRFRMLFRRLTWRWMTCRRAWSMSLSRLTLRPASRMVLTRLKYSFLNSPRSSPRKIAAVKMGRFPTSSTPFRS